MARIASRAPAVPAFGASKVLLASNNRGYRHRDALSKEGDDCACSYHHRRIKAKDRPALDSVSAAVHQKDANLTCVSCILAAASSNVLKEWSPPKLRVVAAHELKTGPKIYAMTRTPRGRCIILNNTDFDSPLEPRNGSEIDVCRMDDLFKQLLFRVTVGSNLRAVEIRDLLKNASQADSLKDDDCLVVVIMSHGTRGSIYGTDGEKVLLDHDVFYLFNNENCPALQGKPKLFFVQACRGIDWDSGTDDVRETSDSPQARTSSLPRRRMPSFSDMHIAYATVPGYVALKNARTGSWFLSAVSEVFSEHACVTPLDGLMHLVNEHVMARYAHDGSMQTPSVDKYGMTKDLYFNPGHPA